MRTELQQLFSELETTIATYSGKGEVTSDTKVFDVAFDSFIGFNVDSRLDALDKANQLVNRAIGKVRAEGKTWPALKDDHRLQTKEINKQTTDTLKAFVSHGKGGGALLKLEKFLRQLGVVPVIVKDQPSSDRTVDTKVQDCLNEADFVIIFATGDDVIKGKEKNIKQPRQNVIHEIGLAQETHPGKIVYLLEESAEFPSNIKPKVYESFARQSLDDAFTVIVRELRNWGYLKVAKI